MMKKVQKSGDTFSFSISGFLMSKLIYFKQFRLCMLGVKKNNDNIKGTLPRD